MACILPSIRSGVIRDRVRSINASHIPLSFSTDSAAQAVLLKARPLSSSASPSSPAPAIPSAYMTPFHDMTARNPQSPSSRPHENSPTHTLNIKSSRNNIHITYTSHTKGGKTFATITGGSDRDFKKANRSSYEAAHQAALKAFAKIQETGGSNHKITVAFNGLQGQGREAVAAALAGSDGDKLRGRIVKVEDRTPIKIGGTRAKKPRRL